MSTLSDAEWEQRHVLYRAGAAVPCVQCGQPFRARRPHALTCTARCHNDRYIAARRERRQLGVRLRAAVPCAYCGGTLSAGRADKRTCSARCRQALRRRTVKAEPTP